MDSSPLGTFENDPTPEKVVQAMEDLRWWEEMHPIPFVEGETDEQRWARRWRIRNAELPDNGDDYTQEAL